MLWSAIARCLAIAASLGALVTLAVAAEVKVAVAANFAEPAREIAKTFEAATGHKLVLSFGATGQIFAQISQGAPFEVFLAADMATPHKAVVEGLAVDGTAFTYAYGQLVLFSKTPGLVAGEASLASGRFTKIAIANPVTAPYGAAAVEVMKALGVYDQMRPKIVQGNNIGQTFQFIDTGNAELGFIALSQIARIEGGSRWIVPADLHSPIAQGAVLLKPGADRAAAKAFLAFLGSREARKTIETYGYRGE